MEKAGEGILKVLWKDKYVQFEEHRILCKTDKIKFCLGNKVLQVGAEIADPGNNGNKFYVNPRPDMEIEGNAIAYEYKGNRYFLNLENAAVRLIEETVIEITPVSEEGVMVLCPDTRRHS